MNDENITAQALNRDLEKRICVRGSGKCSLMLIKRRKLSFLVKGTNRTIQTSDWEMMQQLPRMSLGLILDSKLEFQSHIREAILKVRRGNGMIKCLSKCVYREVLEQIYKLYVRPHLDYGDIIYHKNDPEIHLHFTQKLEQTQYSAALAVTGAWRGTSGQTI